MHFFNKNILKYVQILVTSGRFIIYQIESHSISIVHKKYFWPAKLFHLIGKQFIANERSSYNKKTYQKIDSSEDKYYLPILIP